MSRPDLRTRQGREAEVAEQVEREGGFSVFWATENRVRAHAICRLEDAGRLVRQGESPFPWCRYRMANP